MKEDTIEWRLVMSFGIVIKEKKFSWGCKECRLGSFALELSKHVPLRMIMGVINRMKTEKEIESIYGVKLTIKGKSEWNTIK